MALTETQLITDIKKGNLKNVYLITGEENYSIDKISDCFEHNVVPEDFIDFDQTILYGRDVTMEGASSQ